MGSEQKDRVSLLWLTFSSRLASLLLRWKTADTDFVVLSFSFQVWRYSIHVRLSCLCWEPLPLPASLHQQVWLLDHQRMHTFWRLCLAGQRFRCWREGMPGRILVRRRSWGIVCGLQLWKNRYVQVLIIADVWKQADSTEACCEARVGSVVNYPKSDFCNICCKWESSHGSYVVQACSKLNPLLECPQYYKGYKSDVNVTE